MEAVYLDSNVWIKEFFIYKLKNRRPTDFPNLSKFNPQKIQLLLSPLAVFEISDKLIENKKIEKFCSSRPYLDIWRCRRDITKVKLSPEEYRNINQEIQRVLIDRILAVIANPIPKIKKKFIEGLIAKSLAFSISFIDALHAFLADEYRCDRFITADGPLCESLLNMKRAEKVPYVAITHLKSFGLMAKKFN